MLDAPLTRAHAPAHDDGPVLETTVGGVLRAAAAATPDAPALLEIDGEGRDGRAWTFATLLHDAEALALDLSTRFAPGERVCVWAPNAPEWVLMEYACALAGLSMVTANPSYQARELAYVLRQSRAAGLFLVREHRGNPMLDIAREAVREAGDALREITDMEGPAPPRGDRRPALPEVRPGDEAQVQYTSGTTGFPKGARLHHRGLTNNARFHARRMGLSPGESWGGTMPLFHTAGCGMCVLGQVQLPGRVILFRQFDAAQVLDAAARHGIEMLPGVPTMLVAMLEEQKARPRDLSRLRTSESGGAMVPPELVRRVRRELGSEIQVVYGQTECSPVLTLTLPGDPEELVAGTAGTVLPHTELQIRRPADGSVADVGEQGEIHARGYLTMLGYNDDPEATARTVDAEGWLATGDLGTLDARGYLRITGRVKEMIIRGGENLFPAEIENALLEHPDIAEAHVIGLPDDRWGEIVAAAIRLRAGAATPTVEALRAHCRARLSPQKTPAAWAAVAGFPLTGSGKVQKFALREMWAAGEVPTLAG